MKFFDTHCHIQEPDYPLPMREVEARAHAAGVDFLLCVGTDVKTSQEAVEFAAPRPQVWASIGLHPHDAKLGPKAFEGLSALLSVAPDGSAELSSEAATMGAGGGRPKIVAIGECGLDYFYNNSPKKDQEKALRFQIELALQHDLPLIFHVREAFADFWPIFDSYKNLRGVLHSFTDTQQNADKALARGLHLGVNGIATFTKNAQQLQVIKSMPLSKMLLETDAPFLTPHPFRGTVNEPAYVRVVAEFLADLRGEPLGSIAQATTQNAHKLFKTKTS